MEISSIFNVNDIVWIKIINIHWQTAIVKEVMSWEPEYGFMILVEYYDESKGKAERISLFEKFCYKYNDKNLIIEDMFNDNISKITTGI